MVNPDAYPDQFHMVDRTSHIDETSRKAPSGSGRSCTLSTFGNNKNTIDLLKRVAPRLIQWRLLIFYAAFFRGPAYEPQVSNQLDRIPVIDMPVRTQRVSELIRQQANRYAARKARLEANSLLGSLEGDMAKLDWNAFHEWYISDKRACQRRCVLANIKSKASLPAVRAVCAASHQLDIPIRQLELAIGMYLCYTDLLESKTATWETGEQNNAYEKLDAARMAGDSRWLELAQIVYDDFKDVSTFSVLCKVERELQGRCAELGVFLNAIKSCRHTYFDDIEVASKLCRCGYGHGHGYKLGVVCRLWSWNSKWSSGDSSSDDDQIADQCSDGKVPTNLDESSPLNPLCFSRAKAELIRVRGVKANSAAGLKNVTVRYKLSKAERSRQERPVDQTMQKLQRAIRSDRKPIKTAMCSRACLRMQKKDDRIESLPLIPESNEE